MWHKWTTLVLVCCALVRAEEVAVEETTRAEDPTTAEPTPVATTLGPPHTLDRKASELAWRAWLQSAESVNQNAPPRRITTKSLFITPLVCPKGQRLDRNGCVQVLTINKEEHERNLLAQLNALFTPSPGSGGDLYDYGDEDLGPLQLSIPIGLDPLAAPLQGQDPSAQAQEFQENFVKIDKKDRPEGDASIEAELELLKLQSNYTYPSRGTDGVEQNNLTNMHLHPKRDSVAVNVTDTDSLNKTTEDVGQKEVVYGHVNVDPVMYHLNNEDTHTDTVEKEQQQQTNIPQPQKTPSHETVVEGTQLPSINKNNTSTTATEKLSNTPQVLKKDGDQTKLNPENDYSDIGEAIKLISRYAEVTTDDNFAKDQKKIAATDDSILGTRTKLQHRRNKPKESDTVQPLASNDQPNYRDKPTHNVYPKNGVYYRYPWPSQHVPTPPPDYPFRHLQDYWPGRNKFGGVYSTHENPRRHHHSYPHNLRSHGYPYVGSANLRDAYPEQLKGYIHRVAQRHLSPVRPYTNNQDLYTLLGLRHWFSSEGMSKR